MAAWGGDRRAGREECKVKISIGDSTLTLSSTPTEQQQHLMTEFLTAVTPTRTGDS